MSDTGRGRAVTCRQPLERCDLKPREVSNPEPEEIVNTFPPGISEAVWPCSHLHFSSATVISSFWSPNYDIIHVYPASGPQLSYA